MCTRRCYNNSSLASLTFSSVLPKLVEVKEVRGSYRPLKRAKKLKPIAQVYGRIPFAKLSALTSLPPLTSITPLPSLTSLPSLPPLTSITSITPLPSLTSLPSLPSITSITSNQYALANSTLLAEGFPVTISTPGVRLSSSVSKGRHLIVALVSSLMRSSVSVVPSQ